MKGNPKVIAVLSEVLKAELTAINQYFLHAEMCENWGYQKLAKHTRAESIEEMQHAEKLIEHILYLDGTPNMSDYFKINIGQNVKAQLEFDLQVEYEAVKRLNEGIEVCVKAGDNGSRVLSERDSYRRGRAHRLAGRAATCHRRNGFGELPGAATARRQRVVRKLVGTAPRLLCASSAVRD